MLLFCFFLFCSKGNIEKAICKGKRPGRKVTVKHHPHLAEVHGTAVPTDAVPPRVLMSTRKTKKRGVSPLHPRPYKVFLLFAFSLFFLNIKVVIGKVYATAVPHTRRGWVFFGLLQLINQLEIPRDNHVGHCVFFFYLYMPQKGVG